MMTDCCHKVDYHKFIVLKSFESTAYYKRKSEKEAKRGS